MAQTFCTNKIKKFIFTRKRFNFMININIYYANLSPENAVVYILLMRKLSGRASVSLTPLLYVYFPFVSYYFFYMPLLKSKWMTIQIYNVSLIIPSIYSESLLL